MRPLLRGTLEPRSYAALLRNLHAIYAALETQIAAHASEPAVAPFAHEPLFRTRRLARDLEMVEGEEWAISLDIVSETQRYVDRLTSIPPHRLLAHAYVRYFGDVSGGQHIARIVRRSLGTRFAGAVEFYDFSELGDLTAFKHEMRARLDALPLDANGVAEIVAEARWSFEAHARLFEELDSSAHGTARAIASTPTSLG